MVSRKMRGDDGRNECCIGKESEKMAVSILCAEAGSFMTWAVTVKWIVKMYWVAHAHDAKTRVRWR
jgi:hypothetical protein